MGMEMGSEIHINTSLLFILQPRLAHQCRSDRCEVVDRPSRIEDADVLDRPSPNVKAASASNEALTETSGCRGGVQGYLDIQHHLGRVDFPGPGLSTPLPGDHGDFRRAALHARGVSQGPAPGLVSLPERFEGLYRAPRTCMDRFEYLILDGLGALFGVSKSRGHFQVGVPTRGVCSRQPGPVPPPDHSHDSTLGVLSLSGNPEDVRLHGRRVLHQEEGLAGRPTEPFARLPMDGYGTLHGLSMSPRENRGGFRVIGIPAAAMHQCQWSPVSPLEIFEDLRHGLRTAPVRFEDLLDVLHGVVSGNRCHFRVGGPTRGGYQSQRGPVPLPVRFEDFILDVIPLPEDREALLSDGRRHGGYQSQVGQPGEHCGDLRTSTEEQLVNRLRTLHSRERN